jgi:hypothetical protein
MDENVGQDVPTIVTKKEFEGMINGTVKMVVFGEARYKCIQDREEIYRFTYAYDLKQGFKLTT